MDGFLLVLAIGAQIFPQERDGIETEDINPDVGQEKHLFKHGFKHGGVAVVEVPLEVVEGCPGPFLDFRLPGKVAGRKIGEYLG